MEKHYSEVLCAIDKEGKFIKANTSCQLLLGYKCHELEGQPYINFVHADDKPEITATINNIREGHQISVFNARCVHKNGKVVPVAWSIMWLQEAEVIALAGHVAEEKEEQSASEELARYQAMIKCGADMIGLVDEAGNQFYVGGATTKILGYEPEQLIGKNVFELVHPEDIAKVEALWAEVGTNEYFQASDFRFKAADGTWKWIETVVSNQLHNPLLKALVINSRDITEYKAKKLKLEEREQLHKNLFDKNPDVIFLQDTDGFVTEVNQQFCEVFGVSREQAINRLTISFLPPEMVPVCVRYFQKSLNGSTTRYDLEMITANNERRFYDAIKFPVVLEGNVTYIKTILKDITPIIRSYETVQQQAKKLSTIFESITNALITLDKDWNFTYINHEAEKILHLDKKRHIGQNIWDVFPGEVNGEFYKQYHTAVASGKAVHFEAYYSGGDRWMEVRAFPSAEGVAIYFDDITEKVTAIKELEKLSLVASNTTNGVIILNSELKIEWVNKGFTKLTGYNLEESVGKWPGELLHREQTDETALKAELDKVHSGEAVSFEILNFKKSGEKIYLSVQVTPVYDENRKIVRFVTIQTDITEKVKAQKELEKLSLVASKTSNSVLIADKDWKIEWVNEGFTRLTGYNLEEAAGKKPSEFLHNEETDTKAYKLLEEKLYNGESISLEVLNITKSQEEIWINVDISPVLDEKGTITRFIEVQTDITALKKSELELSRLAQDLYSQNTDLQQFTYIVSHNLRAPVATALGLANLLPKMNKNSELYETSLSKLKQSIIQLDSVLRDVNSILSIRDSKINLELEQVKISHVFQQAQAMLEEPLQRCGGQVIYNIVEDVRVRVNKAYLYSIFYNLLSNAIKYRSEERSLKVHIKCFGSTEKGTLISFSDNGSGFDMSKANNDVFKLYKRFHLNKKGRGIGLYLVKTHLESMGGHIEVSSQIGVGTKFLIYLPKN